MWFPAIAMDIADTKSGRRKWWLSDELTTAERRDLSPLQVFFLKVAIVTAAILIVLYCIGYFLQSFVAAKATR